MIDKKFLRYFFNLLAFSFFLFKGILFAEPMIVLEYSSSNNSLTNNEHKNNFTKDENYSTTHRVNKNETLSTIMQKYYGNSNLNLQFIQTAIVHKNKKVFVRSNPNFMFAGKKLYLPSINEIKNLVYKNKKKVKEIINETNQAEIYFFGN